MTCDGLEVEPDAKVDRVLNEDSVVIGARNLETLELGAELFSGSTVVAAIQDRIQKLEQEKEETFEAEKARLEMIISELKDLEEVFSE